METLRTIWTDISRDLKQQKDDAEISEMQGMYWTLITADRLRMQHIAKRNSGAFATTFVLPVQTAAPFLNRPFVVMPASIYDYDLDAGIDYLSYFAPDACKAEFTRILMFRTDPSTYRSREGSVYQRASVQNPYFYRERERLYLLGVDFQLENVEVRLYTTLPDISVVDPDMPLDFPKELLYTLKRAVFEDGRIALGLPGRYLKNDGTNRPAEQITDSNIKLVSVNSELANSPND